ncbi:MAG: ATP-binding protein [Firmicutes bacterium]|nr:ATP-binding protein [Bacillota bacterium]
MKRITLIVGHYGSGKTEFSVNLAIDLRKKYKKAAILDLDIANPYFRSRERKRVLEANGVDVHFNSYGHDITEDLPAISATIKAPLENRSYMTVADVGGNDSGARILNQFEKYFKGNDCDMFCVINANRPETSTVESAKRHIRMIEEETGLRVTGLINNTHLLRETEVSDILDGYRLCKTLSQILDVPLVWNVCVKELVLELGEEKDRRGLDDLIIYPIELYMRPEWLDAKVGS